MGIENENKIQKLYIRLPVKIKDELTIRQLHQNIIAVHIPRQKSTRWCIIDFENQEKLKEAQEELEKKQIENKLIKIFPYKKGHKRKINTRTGESAKNLINLLKNKV